MKEKLQKFGIPLLVLILIAGVGLFIQRNHFIKTDEPSGTSALTEEEKDDGEFPSAPDFTLADMSGKPVKLTDFKGKVIIVDFWATWCPPCIEEIPHFKDLYQKYEAKGLAIVGISMDEDGIEPVQTFAKENAIPYPIVMADDDVAQDFGGVRGLPTTFIINREGKIVKKLVGYQDLEKFEEVILKFL